jgi:hypothetical protein
VRPKFFGRRSPGKMFAFARSRIASPKSRIAARARSGGASLSAMSSGVRRLSVHDLVPAHLDGLGGACEEGLEERGFEARDGEGEVLELLDVREPAGARVPEDEAVLLEDVRAARGLRRREGVADDLEDDVVRRKREDEHDHAARPRRLDEEVVRRGEVAEEVAVELRLAVLVESEGRVELRDGFLRHERLEEAHERRGVLGVDVEVGAREAEDDGGLVLVAEDGVERDGAGAVQEREDDGALAAFPPHASHEVRTLAAEEDRPEHVERVEGGRAPRRREDPLERARREARVAREVLPPGGERKPRERAPDGGLPAGPPVEGREEPSRARDGQRRGLAADELGAVVDADRVEDAARGRVEERLHELGVPSPRDEGGEARLHPGPDRGIPDAGAEDPSEVADRGVERPPVELEALERVRPHPAPVARGEAYGRPSGDRGELARVRVPCGEEPLGARPAGVVGGQAAFLRAEASSLRMPPSG